jgi:hypothetical protein
MSTTHIYNCTKIASNNVDGFRYGTWGDLIGVSICNNRPCFHVKFHDGVEDYWPCIDGCIDGWDSYKFK